MPENLIRETRTRFEFIQSIHQIDASTWDGLFDTSYPFSQHAFLAALEDSGSVGGNTGWLPNHLIAKRGSDLVCAMPAYIKTHSYGEYVFDWSWADAYQQNGLAYYPKLINAVPFTPATGPRIAVRPSEDKQSFASFLSAALDEECQRRGLSGFHSLFPNKQSAAILNNRPYIATRLGCQFHWFNEDYPDFENFLSRMTARKRKNVLRERRKVNEAGIDVRMQKGGELNPQDWKDFFRLYQRTYLKRSGHGGYLSEAFFLQVGQTLPEHTAVARAFKGGNCVAAALYFYDSETLYGRYWGATEEYDGLHFECCYYQGIEFAIKEQLGRFDPGAQGEHKIQRGFTPILTQSLHHLQQPDFQRAINRFVLEEQAHIQQYTLSAREYLPFKEEEDIQNTNVLI